MHFKAGYYYHIYNRGNNKNKIFFNEDNYIFFLKKVRHELSGYFDFLAYCLMPNHFHFLVQVKEEVSGITHPMTSSYSTTHPMTWSHRMNSSSKPHSNSSDYYDNILSKKISNKIAVLLRSYTRAVNIQEKRTGSLFQQKTKAKCLNEFNTSRNNYLTTCFYYIHQNPLNAGITNRLEDWKYSSFLDYAGLRNGTLCNQSLAYEIINFNKENFIEQSYAVIEEKSLKGIWL
jgi:putative transposase